MVIGEELVLSIRVNSGSERQLRVTLMSLSAAVLNAGAVGGAVSVAVASSVGVTSRTVRVPETAVSVAVADGTYVAVSVGATVSIGTSVGTSVGVSVTAGSTTSGVPDKSSDVDSWAKAA